MPCLSCRRYLDNMVNVLTQQQERCSSEEDFPAPAVAILCAIRDECNEVRDTATQFLRCHVFTRFWKHESTLVRMLHVCYQRSLHRRALDHLEKYKCT